jgi:DNA-binding transcriptional MerR regulator
MTDHSRAAGTVAKENMNDADLKTGLNAGTGLRPGAVAKSAVVPAAPSARPGMTAATSDESDVRLSIGELAEELGLTTRTIRFYEQKGLISPARKGVARAYGRRDRARMRLILQGKNLGFSLEDIAEYLALYDSDPSQVVQTQLLHTKVTAAIADLETKQNDIERALTDLKDILFQCDEHLKSGQA